MSNLDLEKLNREYTQGIIPRALYLDTRRDIIDRFTGVIDDNAVEEIDEPIDPTEPDTVRFEGSQDTAAEKSAAPASPQPIKHKSKSMLVSVAATVLVLVAVLVLVFDGSEDVAVQSESSRAGFNSGRVDDLHRLTRRLADDTLWNADTLNAWLAAWESLSPAQRDSLRHGQHWDTLKEILPGRYADQFLLAERGDTQAEKNVKIIDGIAIALGIAVVIPQAPPPPPVALANSQPIRKKKAVDAQPVESSAAEIEEKADSASPSTSDAKISEAIARKDTQADDQAAVQLAEKNKQPDARKNTEWKQQSDQLLLKLRDALLKRDAELAASYFAEDGSYQDFVSRPNIKRNLQKEFDNAPPSKMEFSKHQWSRNANGVSGVGRYLADKTTPDPNLTQKVTADFTIDLVEEDGAWKIASFQLTGKDVITLQAELKVDTGTERFLKPTNVELQSLISTFVGIYERGDINALMKLFTEDAKTNDTNSLNGIRDDYESLFKSTVSRQMFVKNMRWKIEDHYGRGAGEFVVLVTQNGQNAEQTFKGKINITAKKTTRGLFITQLLHE